MKLVNELKLLPGFSKEDVINAICKKCFVILPTKGKPQTTVCPAGSTHQWENIGKLGNAMQLKCGKCQVSLSFAKAPKNPGTCKKGKQHDWKPAKTK